MDINKLILTVKKKIKENIILENIQVEDKTFLHKKTNKQIELYLQ